MTQISLPFNPQPGDAEDISHIMGDFAAVLAVVNGDIRNDNVNAAAAIAYSKLNLANGVKNGDIDPAAAIAVSKLAAGADSRQFVGMVAGVPTWKKGPALLTNTTPVGTGAATVETDLQTITIGAAALAIGDVVRIRAGGTSLGNTSTVLPRLYFGGTVVAVDFVETSATEWMLEALVVVTGASTQKAAGSGFVRFAGAGQASPRYATPTAAISGAITVKTTGTTPNAGDEVTSEMLTVELIPA